jgi:hypothetical protein
MLLNLSKALQRGNFRTTQGSLEWPERFALDHPEFPIEVVPAPDQQRQIDKAHRSSEASMVWVWAWAWGWTCGAEDISYENRSQAYG